MEDLFESVPFYSLFNVMEFQGVEVNGEPVTHSGRLLIKEVKGNKVASCKDSPEIRKFYEMKMNLPKRGNTNNNDNNNGYSDIEYLEEDEPDVNGFFASTSQDQGMPRKIQIEHTQGFAASTSQDQGMPRKPQIKHTQGFAASTSQNQGMPRKTHIKHKQGFAASTSQNQGMQRKTKIKHTHDNNDNNNDYAYSELIEDDNELDGNESSWVPPAKYKISKPVLNQMEDQANPRSSTGSISKIQETQSKYERLHWTRTATLKLIAMYKDNIKDLQKDHSPRNIRFWSKLAAAINEEELGLNMKVSFSQVLYKWNKLYSEYKETRDKNATTGEKRNDFLYYDELDEIVGRDAKSCCTETADSLEFHKKEEIKRGTNAKAATSRRNFQERFIGHLEKNREQREKSFDDRREIRLKELEYKQQKLEFKKQKLEMKKKKNGC